MTSTCRSCSESGLTFTKPGSTARVKRPNLVTRPTLPWRTDLYGFGQTKQPGMDPKKPTAFPSVFTGPDSSVHVHVSVHGFWRTHSSRHTTHVGSPRRGPGPVRTKAAGHPGAAAAPSRSVQAPSTRLRRTYGRVHNPSAVVSGRLSTSPTFRFPSSSARDGSGPTIELRRNV